MATELKRYVCTASSGGDGTTSATSGANAAYAHLNDAIDYIQASYANLVTADVYVNIEITGDNSAADTTAVDISSITTDATRYVNIYTTSGCRHDGKYNTAKYRHETTSYIGFAVSVNYIRITGLQIKNSTSGSSHWDVAFYVAATNYTGQHRFDKLVIVSGGSAGFINFEAGDLIISNSVFIASGVYGLEVSGTWSNPTGNQILNCVCITKANSYGLNGGTGSYAITIKNTYAYSNGANADFAGTANYTTCASSDGSASTATVAYSTSSGAYFTNVSDGSEDFHIGTSSSLKDAGTDLSATFTDDINGNTRSGTWDIGADEYVSGGEPPAATGFMSTNKGMW